MKKLLFVFLLFTQVTQAQDFINTGQQFEVKIGINNLNIADRNENPTKYKSNQVQVSVGFVKSDRTTYSNLALSFAVGGLKEIGNNTKNKGLFKNAIFSPIIEYKYLKTAFSSRNLFGGGFTYQLFRSGSSNYAFGNGAFTFEYIKKFREITIGTPSIGIGLPIVSVVSQFSNDDTSNLSSLFKNGTYVATFNKVQGLNVTTRLDKLIGPKTTIGIEHVFRYNRFATGKYPVSFLQSSLRFRGLRTF